MQTAEVCMPQAHDDFNGNGRYASAIHMRDRVIYAVIGVLLTFLSFLGGNMYARLGVVELLLREIVTSNILREQRFQEDHALLSDVERARQQRTVELSNLRADSLDLKKEVSVLREEFASLKERLRQIEVRLEHRPQKGT